MASQTGTPDYPQKITFRSAEYVSLLKILQLHTPRFIGADLAQRQLRYIDGYVRDPALGCKTVVVEDHYIDRDHMEDHSVFYSKSLYPYPNSCLRVHFFSLKKKPLEAELRRLREVRAERDGKEVFADECAKFSKKNYLGFTVIKPLPGCPVGRTVLRCLPENSGKGHTRKFKCAFDYDTHLLGVRLTVNGLAFQQQDVGVSACATTALWSSLQRARHLEQGASATPAQITMHASQFTLPFGRPMPSEGLSLDQMCIAVQALGYSPTVHKAEYFDETRSLLFSSVSSGMSPVLIIKQIADVETPDFDKDVRHAVAAVGIGVATASEQSESPAIKHRSMDLKAVYVHDDREGPYLKGTVQQHGESLHLHFDLPEKRAETWVLTHILIPLHVKIRLSFAQLHAAGWALVTRAQSWALSGKAMDAPQEADKTNTVWRSRIFRSTAYLEDLLGKQGNSAKVDSLCRFVRLPRYLGVIRIQSSGLDPFDVLLDTTSTERNLNCLAIMQLAAAHPETAALCRLMVKQFGGRWII